MLDVRKNWNFGDKSERDMILEQFEWKKPILLIGADRGSPKCVNTEHVKFLNELYKKQRDRGGLCLHEQAKRSGMKDSEWIQERRRCEPCSDRSERVLVELRSPGPRDRCG